MNECPFCGENLSQVDLGNEFCQHCFADLDTEDLEQIGFKFQEEDDDLIYDDF